MKQHIMKLMRLNISLFVYYISSVIITDLCVYISCVGLDDLEWEKERTQYYYTISTILVLKPLKKFANHPYLIQLSAQLYNVVLFENNRNRLFIFVKKKISISRLF